MLPYCHLTQSRIISDQGWGVLSPAINAPSALVPIAAHAQHVKKGFRRPRSGEILLSMQDHDPFLRCRKRICKAKVAPGGKSGKSHTFMDDDTDQASENIPPSADCTAPMQETPTYGPTLQAEVRSSTLPSTFKDFLDGDIEPALSPQNIPLSANFTAPIQEPPVHGLALQAEVGSSSSVPPISSLSSLDRASTSTPPLLQKPDRLGKKGTKKNYQTASGDGPRKQKLQLEREDLLRIEQKVVKKVASSKGLAGYIYICLKCDKYFRIRLRCVDHARSCGEQNTAKRRKKSQRKLFCNVCDHVEFTRAELQKHRKKVHSSLIRPKRCTRCQKVFASSKSYFRHVKRHLSSKTYACPVAGPELPVTNLGDIFCSQKPQVRPRTTS